MAQKQFFRIIFQSQNGVIELHVRQIYQSELCGFIEVEELIFKNRYPTFINLEKEKVKSIFDNVKRSFIPISAIIRIDELENNKEVEDSASLNSIVSFLHTKKKLTPNSS